MLTIQNLADYLQVDMDTINPANFQLALDEVEVLIRSYANSLPEDVSEWPKSATVVALRVMSRGAATADLAGLSSFNQSAGPFQQSFGVSENTSSGSFYLTKQDKAILDGRGRKGGAYAIETIPADTINNGSPGYRQIEWLWGGSPF